MHFFISDEKFGIKSVQYRKYQKTFSVDGWPEGIKFKQPYDYGKNQLARIMEAKDVIQFVPIAAALEIDAPEATASEPVVETILSDVDTSQPTQGEPDVNLTTARAKVVRAKANSFAKKGDIVPCIAEEGGYWLFQCSSKVKTNGKMKGKWLDSVQGSRNFILLSDVSEIDERTVLLKNNMRMVVPPSFFDFADNDNFVLSIAGHNCLCEMVKEQNR